MLQLPVPALDRAFICLHETLMGGDGFGKIIVFGHYVGIVPLFFYKLYRRLCYIRLGRPVRSTGCTLEHLKYFSVNVFGQKKVRAYPFFGLCHTLIMYGFIILLPGIPNMASERLLQHGIAFVANNSFYLFIKDLFIVLVLVGVAGCLQRRTIRKPDWLKNNLEAFGLLLLIFTIVSTEALYHAVSLSTSSSGSALWPAPLAGTLSRFFIGLPAEVIGTAAAVFWWTHFLTIFAMFWIIPNSKHLHMLFVPLNTYWHSLEHKGVIKALALDEMDGKEVGAGKMEDFTRKQLFEAYTCTKCGRCNDQCPAFRSGEPVKPKPLQGRFRKHIEEMAPLLLKQRAGRSDNKDKKKKFIGGVYKEEFIWGCAMCGGCEEACPVSIEHTAKIIAMRRYLIMTKKDYSAAMQRFFANLQSCGNPWGVERKGDDTGSITGNSGAEYVYFPGCAAAYDTSAGHSAAALKNLMQIAGVSFVTLGVDAWCCGETARRMGNEELFQQIAQNNINKWNKLGVRKIITSCPHCYNTLKNEYPQFGGRWEVIHHSVLLAGLLKEGRLKLNNSRYYNITITYHDPCYLGRYNDVYREPREILGAMTGVRLLEMQRSESRSFCCGAGGGRYWSMDVAENLVAANRLQQVQATKAAVLCTACPYCKLLLEKTAAGRGEQELQIMDIAELLEKAVLI